MRPSIDLERLDVLVQVEIKGLRLSVILRAETFLTNPIIIQLFTVLEVVSPCVGLFVSTDERIRNEICLVQVEIKRLSFLNGNRTNSFRAYPNKTVCFSVFEIMCPSERGIEFEKRVPLDKIVLGVVKGFRLETKRPNPVFVGSAS